MTVPEISIRTAESSWSQNTDGMWTWHPQPESAKTIYGPLGDLVPGVGRIHEAGHAVVALLAGLGVDSVNLSPGRPEFMFHTVVTGSTNSWTLYAAYLAAGERAADRWLRETGEWTTERAWSVERGAKSDRVKALRVAKQIDQPLDIPAHPWDGWTEVCSWADGLLEAHWHRVQAVAEALVTEGSLDPGAVARITGLTNPSV